MHALIIAAGFGSRLRDISDSKPMTPIAGIPLLELGEIALDGAAADLAKANATNKEVYDFLASAGAKFGMGVRSQRYSMVVNDGVVEKLNIEEGGEFKVSAADYMLEQL